MPSTAHDNPSESRSGVPAKSSGLSAHEEEAAHDHATKALPKGPFTLGKRPLGLGKRIAALVKRLFGFAAA